MIRSLLFWKGAVLDSFRIANGPALPVGLARDGEGKATVLFFEPQSMTARLPRTGKAVWDITRPADKKGNWSFAQKIFPDGSQRFYFSSRGFREEIDPATGRMTELPVIMKDPHQLAARGKFLATAAKNTVQLFRDGKEAWQHKSNFPITAGPVITGDSIIVATGMGTVMALDLESGKEAWRTDIDTPLLNPLTASDGLLLGCTQAGSVHAFDPATGNSKWTLDVGDTLMQEPQFAGGLVLLAVGRNFILAVDAETGKVVARTSWPTRLTAAKVVAVEKNPGVLCLDESRMVTSLSWPGLEIKTQLELPHKPTPAILECPSLELPWAGMDELAEAEHVALVCDEKGFAYMLGLEERP